MIYICRKRGLKAILNAYFFYNCLIENLKNKNGKKYVQIDQEPPLHRICLEHQNFKFESLHSINNLQEQHSGSQPRVRSNKRTGSSTRAVRF